MSAPQRPSTVPVQPNRRRALAWGALGLASLAVAGYGGRKAWQRFRLGEAPDVAPVTLDGTPIPIGSLRGQVVVVDFWATTCATCVAEMPELIALHREYAPQGLRTLAVAVHWDTPEQVARFAERRALPFDVAYDTGGTVQRAFPWVRVTPTVFVIDRQGRLAKRYIGTVDFQDLRQRIDAALAA